MNFAHLLHMYGYVVVLAITSITFSTGLVLAGFVAHQGYLNVYWTLLIACVGSFIFTELYFICSRFGFHALFAHHPAWSVKIEELKKRLKSKKGVSLACLLFRFIPGFRMMMPVLLAPFKVSFLFFSVCNLIGSFVWSVCFILLGFYFGVAAEHLIRDLKHYEVHAAIFIIVIGFLYFLIRWCYKKRRQSR